MHTFSLSLMAFSVVHPVLHSKGDESKEVEMLSTVRTSTHLTNHSG